MKSLISLIANRAARQYGSNRATEIRLSTDCRVARVIRYKGYHAVSRTGIIAPAKMASVWPRTYSYVSAVCVVVVPDIDAIYSDDSH